MITPDHSLQAKKTKPLKPIQAKKIGKKSLKSAKKPDSKLGNMAKRIADINKEIEKEAKKETKIVKGMGIGKETLRKRSTKKL